MSTDKYDPELAFQESLVEAGLQKHRKLLHSFWKTIERVEQTSPPTSKAYERGWAARRTAIDEFLNGRDKKWFLWQLKELYETQPKPGEFLTHSSKNMWTCLAWLYNPKIATQEVREVLAIAKLIAAFSPGKGEPKALVGYSVLILDDDYIPATYFYNKVGVYGFRKSMKVNPWQLFENWSEETLRSFFLHLKDGGVSRLSS